MSGSFSSFTAVSAVSTAVSRVSKEKQFQESLRKVFCNYFICIYQSRMEIHSSNPFTTLAK